MSRVAREETRAAAIRSLQRQNAELAMQMETCDQSDRSLKQRLQAEYDANVARIRGIELMAVGEGFAQPPKDRWRPIEREHWMVQLRDFLQSPEAQQLLRGDMGGET